jgi:gamma-glutamylcyclotransferase (GGCT)/AIG2-like uncharacterized protein YtfP
LCHVSRIGRRCWTRPHAVGGIILCAEETKRYRSARNAKRNAMGIVSGKPTIDGCVSVRNTGCFGETENMPPKPKNNKLAVYGILRKGYALDLEHAGCKFEYEAKMPYIDLYRIQEGVGARVSLERDHQAQIEVFTIPNEHTWSWLDEIETNGVVYTRTEKQVITPDGKVDSVWIYLHTMFPPDVYGTRFPRIPNGNFTGTDKDLPDDI